jgi:hypothetical protein
MLKVGGQNLEENIVKLINKAWDEETIPQRWKETLICPLHKKGDRSKCEKSRGIALMDTIQGRYKVWQQLNISRMVSRKSLRFGKELRAFKFYSFQFFQFYTFICFRDTRLT